MKTCILNSRTKKRGFTLIELMYATVLASVLMMAVGALVVGYWRSAHGFMDDAKTMEEMALLARIFTDNARSLPSSNMATGETASDQSTSSRGDGIIFHHETPTALHHDCLLYTSPSPRD